MAHVSGEGGRLNRHKRNRNVKKTSKFYEKLKKPQPLLVLAVSLLKRLCIRGKKRIIDTELTRNKNLKTSNHVNTKINQLSARRFQQWISTRMPTRAGAQARAGALIGLGLTLVLGLAVVGSVQAAVQGYGVQDNTITTGMAVALNTSGQVEKSSIAQAEKTLGVVANAQDSTVAVSGTGQQVYVATTGTTAVFVTDVNGVVHKGDLLGPSPIAGVLMRANNGAKGVLGIALSDFSTKNVQSVTLATQDGQSTKARVTLLSLNMDVRFASNNASNTRSLLQKIGEAVVRRPVSNLQVVVAMVILLLLIIVVGAMVYGAISSSIISLGRNPLAKKSIFEGLGQISGLVMLVMILGLAAIYLVLRI